MSGNVFVPFRKPSREIIFSAWETGNVRARATEPFQDASAEPPGARQILSRRVRRSDISDKIARLAARRMK